MDSVPDGVLANILAKVPLGRHKVGMQCVAKQWLHTLHQRAAHSVDTWDEDERMPFNPAAHKEDARRGALVSSGFLTALPCYKGEWRICPQSQYPAACMANLPEHIRKLLLEDAPNSELFTRPPARNPMTGHALGATFSVTISSGSFQDNGFGFFFRGIHNGSTVPRSISSLLPNLEMVHLSCEVNGDRDLGKWLSDLQRLQNVRSVSLEVLISDYEDSPALYTKSALFLGSPECRVSLKILWNGYFSPDISFSNSLAKHLQSFEIHYLYKQPAEDPFYDMDGDCGDRFTDLDLFGFGNCSVLEALKFTFTAGDEDVHPSRKNVFGFSLLPQACKQVVFAVDDGNSEWLPIYRTKPSFEYDFDGWQVVAGNLESDGCFSAPDGTVMLRRN